MHVGVALVGPPGEQILVQRVQVEFGKGMVLLALVEQKGVFLFCGEHRLDAQDPIDETEGSIGEIELASLGGQTF